MPLTVRNSSVFVIDNFRSRVTHNEEFVVETLREVGLLTQQQVEHAQGLGIEPLARRRTSEHEHEFAALSLRIASIAPGGTVIIQRPEGRRCPERIEEIALLETVLTESPSPIRSSASNALPNRVRPAPTGLGSSRCS